MDRTLPAIGLSVELNEQWVELFCRVAATPAIEAPPSFILENREFWCRLDAEGRRRAAAFPFVLVNLNFKNDSTPNGIPGSLVEDLLFETLLFARQTARESLSLAAVTAGLSLAVARRMASLTLSQVRRLAEGAAGCLQVRWTPMFWREILVAAQLADEEALKALRHQGKLLFCGETVASSALILI